MRRLRRRSIIAQACDQVSITYVLRSLGVEIEGAPEPGVNRRVYCPFGALNHDDGGREKQMRVYHDNTAWCFRCRCRYDPVSLLATAWGCSNGSAARRLLARLDGAEEVAPSRMSQVRAGMVAALGMWADVQGVDRTGAAYVCRLADLDGVETEDAAVRWLAVSKESLSPGRTAP